MNALFGVPDVKEMHYHCVKLVSVPSLYGCAMGDVACRFERDSYVGRCRKYCIEDHIWIRESQMPEYLAARLVRGVT
jgi:hypothetical protein